MNIFRSLLGGVWKDPNNAEIVKIEVGELYLVRPGNIRSSRECIFNEAMATIRRSPAEHHFHLVITRVFEDGDQELLEDEAETDDERVFLISEELEFRTGKTSEGEPAFLWRDLDGGVDELYEYVASQANTHTKAFFETCMYRAMYERKYKISADDMKDAAMEEFIYKSPTSVKPAARRKVTDETKIAVSAPKKAPSRSSSASNHDVVVSFPADLHQWNIDTACFEERGAVTAQILQQKGAFNFWMTAIDENNQVVLHHKIASSMNQRVSLRIFSITWNHIEGDDASSWVFRFGNQSDYEGFISAYARSLYETLNDISWDKVKQDDKDYIMGSYDEDVEMRDIQDDEDEEEAVLSELEPEEEYSDEESDEDDNTEPNIPRDGLTNSMLTVGYKGDRSYVVRGNNIGVFNHSHDGVKYGATISKLKGKGGKEFKPKQVMLHDQDTKMILMDPNDPHSLFNMDLERGAIVEEWRVHDDINVDHMAPESKFAPTTREQTLVGISHNALFRIDPRVSGQKLVDSQYKQYTSKNKFSGVATTAKGGLAVASEKGDIRLFDSVGKNAKTALPPLGDPILGIDVTSDGRWIVATTKSYLLLLDTLIGEGRYAGSLGFDRSFPAAAKPMPQRLQLRSEHVAYMKHDITFTPARFNAGHDQEENAIVTSTGQYVIAWDFAKVKKGQLDRYEIKKYEDRVVQDNFKFGDDKEIIVALQNNVLAVNKKQLKKPTRQSLSLQSGYDGPSRSAIVNTPY